MWTIAKTLLKVLVVAPFCSLWFFVDTAIGFAIDGWEEMNPKQQKVGGFTSDDIDITV